MRSSVQQNPSWRMAVSGNLVKEGYPLTSLWAFDFTGVNPETGMPMYKLPTEEECPEAKEDASAYLKYVGTLEPDFSMGFSTSLRYKTISLGASFNLNTGGTRFLGTVFGEDMVNSLPSAYLNLPKEMVNRWKKPGDISDMPTIPYNSGAGVSVPFNGYSEPPHRLYNYADIRAVDAWFLRCNNLSISYTLPEKFVKAIYLKNLSLSGNVSNPFRIVSKDFKGMDPEVATGSQPISRTYSLGLNISL